jgi:hypothetical protein
MIWPLKLSPTGSPVATLSPNNFNTVSIFAICFFLKDHFCQILEAESPFGDFSQKNKQITARDLSRLQPYVTFGIIRLFYCDTAACIYGFADSIGWMCN